MAKGPKVGPVVATQKQPVLLKSKVDMSPIAIVDIGVWDRIRYLGRSKSFRFLPPFLDTHWANNVH